MARRLLREARKVDDVLLRLRVLVVLHYAKGLGCNRIAEALQIAPGSVARIGRRYLKYGEAGLNDGRKENGVSKVDEDLIAALAEIVCQAPSDHGWTRPTWTRDLLVRALAIKTGTYVSITSVARMLITLKARWGMSRPASHGKEFSKAKRRRWKEIERKVARLPSNEIAFFEDEVDVHLNPRIGRDWMLHRQQKSIETPGRNEKRYLAGALSFDGSQLVVVEAKAKRASLFIALLDELKLRFFRKKRIHLVLDNYVIHWCVQVQRYLSAYGKKFTLHFLAPYSPEHNRIERLWRDFHSNVTQNHTCKSIDELMANAFSYLITETFKRNLRCNIAKNPN